MTTEKLNNSFPFTRVRCVLLKGLTRVPEYSHPRSVVSKIGEWSLNNSKYLTINIELQVELWNAGQVWIVENELVS